PKGLGHSVPGLRELLDEPMEKMEFSCGASKPIAKKIVTSGRKQVIVAGMEAHVCVFQTVRDLLSGEFAVFVVEDAVTSRTEANRSTGLRLCERAGATLTSTETLLFDLLGVAAGRIAEILHVHPSTLTGILKRLEARAVVQRRSDPRDARRALFGLTNKGRKLDTLRTGTVEQAVRRVLEKDPQKVMAAQ